MAYVIKGRSGQPVVKDGKNIFGSDFVEVKLLDLDEKEGTFVARASSKKEDRDRDILHQEGFDLKNFKKNPVIPWSHNYWEPPIAKSIKTWVDTDLMFQPKFDMADEFAVKIFNKYKGGFLTSFSVGFIGQEFTPRDEKDPWFGGREFTKMELLEISCVAVPANPQANVHVNAMGSEPKSLVDLGFPIQFSRKKGGGLFYPIRDVNEFTGPTSVCKLKGLELIYAKTLSDKHPEAAEPQLVGYSFAPDWKEADALSFVKAHSEPTRKSWMYQLDLEESKGLVVTEIVNDVAPILEFAGAMDLGEKDTTALSVYRVVGDKCIDEESPAKLEDEKTANISPPAKELAVEVKIDDMIPKFIECLNTIAGEIKILVSKVDQILIKKPIDLQNGSCDNQDNGNGQKADSLDSKTKSLNDSIEFGENLLTPEDKTSDGESNQIEIDVADISEISQLTQQAGGAVAESLGQQLMEAMKQSGRID